MPVPNLWGLGWVYVFPRLPVRFWYVRQMDCGRWRGVIFGDAVSEPTAIPFGDRASVISTVMRPEVRRGLPIMINDFEVQDGPSGLLGVHAG